MEREPESRKDRRPQATEGSVSGTDLPSIESRRIISVRVDATSYSDATERIRVWAEAGGSRYVCVCNVHMVMEAYDDPDFAAIVNGADLVTPDGMPLVWALRKCGVKKASRVYGPELVPRLLEMAERTGLPVGFHGGTPEVLDALTAEVSMRFPELRLVYACSPPFGPVTDREGELEDIRRSGARILFVALGCPKQERWMGERAGEVPGVMVGVGAAFDFLAGNKPQAPRFVQAAGLEWAFRMATEPRRLWRRYAVHNPRFVALLARQLLLG